MLRSFRENDAEQVMQIWLNGNIDAHPFIAKEYWLSNFEAVQEQITRAEVFVYEANGKIQGFTGIAGTYIAGIFVDGNYRSKGIGSQLLDYAKQTHNELSLGVYKKNERAVSFYFREGFSILSDGIDEDTKEAEYKMVWKAKNINL